MKFCEKGRLFAVSVTLLFSIGLACSLVQPVRAAESPLAYGSWFAAGFQWPHDWLPPENTIPSGWAYGGADGATQGQGEILQEVLIELKPLFERENYSRYYPTFQLAVEFLVDKKGLGEAIEDLMNLIWDLSFGIAFPSALVHWFDNSLWDIQEQFLDWLSELAQSTWGNPCAATISNQLHISIPSLEFEGEFYSVGLSYSSTNPLFDFGTWFEAVDVRPAAVRGCIGSATLLRGSNRTILHAPVVKYGGYMFWADFEYVPTADGRIWLKLSGFGPLANGALIWPGVLLPAGIFQNATAGFAARKSFQTEFPIEHHIGIRLEAVNGDILITGDSDTHGVVVDAMVAVRSDTSEDAQTHLDDVEILVTDSASEFLIQTLQPEHIDGRQYLVEYHIRVPSGFEVAVSQVNGNTQIVDIENGIDVSTENGNLLLSNIAGGIGAHVANGGIRATGLLAAGDRVDLSTTNGNIELRIPTSTSAWISASVDANGQITSSNLDITGPPNNGRTLTGMLGNGDATIELATFNGNIVLIGFD